MTAARLLATTGHGIYLALVACHVGAALLGFGAVALSGVYAASARRLDRPGALEETARFFRARSVGQWAIMAVPILGVAAVAIQPGGHGLLHPWVVIALVLWLVAAAAVVAVASPARASLRAALRAPGPGPADPAAVAAAARRLAAAAAVCDAVFVVAVIDMVIRP